MTTRIGAPSAAKGRGWGPGKPALRPRRLMDWLLTEQLSRAHTTGDRLKMINLRRRVCEDFGPGGPGRGVKEASTGRKMSISPEIEYDFRSACLFRWINRNGAYKKG